MNLGVLVEDGYYYYCYEVVLLLTPGVFALDYPNSLYPSLLKVIGLGANYYVPPLLFDPPMGGVYGLYNWLVLYYYVLFVVD